MPRNSKREIGGLGLLFVILGGWFFAAGFENPWTIGHFCTLAMLIAGVLLGACAVFRR
jgi:hypothetical protein